MLIEQNTVKFTRNPYKCQNNYIKNKKKTSHQNNFKTSITQNPKNSDFEQTLLLNKLNLDPKSLKTQEIKMYSNFNSRIYPEIKNKIDRGLKAIKNSHNSHRGEFQKEFKKINNLNQNFYNKKESIFADLKQLQINLMKKRQNYGLYCSALNKALERTNKRPGFDYDNYFRFRDLEKDREYNFLAEDTDFLGAEEKEGEFERIYNRNCVRERELVKGVGRSKVFLKFEERDCLSDYLDNYVRKMKFFR